MSKYDHPGHVFRPYAHPDDIGYAGWVEDESGNPLGWRKLDGKLLTIEDAGGTSTADPSDPDPSDWWRR